MSGGIHQMSAEEYHADPCDEPSLSSSIAHVLCTSSPKHAWTAHPRLNPAFERVEEDKFSIGTVAHALLLQGEEVVEVVDADSWRTNAAKEARDFARANGLVPLLAKDWGRVQAMAEAVAEQLEVVDCDPPLFAAGKPEQTLIWQENGVHCRARLDWLHDDLAAIDDFKTTSASANPESWSRTLFGIGADMQAVFYLRGLRAVTGAEAQFRFVVQETQPPYALSVVALGPDVLALADAKVDYAVVAWRTCLASGVWPAYPQKVCYAELPAWEEARWMEREAREAA